MQRLLDGVKNGREKKSVLVPGLPLRGHIICPQSGKRLTGSASKSRHGYRVFYYHAQERGAYRIPAEAAHEQFRVFLRSVQPAPEVARLFKDLLADMLAEQGADAHKRHLALAQQLKAIDEKLLRTDEMYIEGNIQADSYERLKIRYAAERKEIASEMQAFDRLNSVDEGKVRWAVEMLTRLDEVWQERPSRPSMRWWVR